jgi:hypothetical protein
MPLVLSANFLTLFRWWVDVAYMVHDDCRGHTGAGMSLGQGFFLIKDKVNQGEVTIKHCPTRQVWTDINTKPKQGLVYRVFRGHVMGILADYKDSDYVGKVPVVSPVVLMLPLTKEQLALQECVGGDAKQSEQTPILLTHA